MPLTRKTRFSGSSIVITIPSQLVKAYNFSSGDSIEIVPINTEEIILRKSNGNEKEVSYE
jgi:antitoxin component of MazEF toxin-antitoxin module